MGVAIPAKKIRENSRGFFDGGWKNCWFAVILNGQQIL
jgi:hypothetical protein